MLREYQKQLSEKGAGILLQYGLVYFAMESRIGKSLTALATADLIPDVSNALFVTKKKAVKSIESDYLNYSPSYLLDVINYEQLHNVTKKYDLIIIDEAHKCGAFPLPSERVKLLKEICKGKPIIFLSATPTPESYSQLYHQLYISSYSPFSSQTTFYTWVRAGYVTVEKLYVYNRESNDYKNANIEKIKEVTAHLFISFTQKDAGFSVSVNEEFIYIPMLPATYKAIDTLTQKKVINTKDHRVILADTAVKAQQKVHQLCSGTIICEDKTAILFDNSKVTYIKDNFSDKKIAIFYKYTAEGEMLKREFNKHWTDDPELFNGSSNLVFISQVVSGREGVNLSTADCLIMYNIDFSATSYWQARARLLTKEREKEAMVYWLFATGGIESKIYDMVMLKKNYTTSHFKKDFNYEGKKLRGGNTKQNNQIPGKGRVVCSQINSNQ